MKPEHPSCCLDRLVRVDMGYGPAEHWVTGKVIDEQTCQTLFGDGVTTDLLVELPGGERTWVSFWEEIPPNDQGEAQPLAKKTMKTLKDSEALPPTTCSPCFEPIRVTITEGAWKGEKGWITGPKNEVDANPITTDGGINLVWFDSEIRRENTKDTPPEGLESSDCSDNTLNTNQ